MNRLKTFLRNALAVAHAVGLIVYTTFWALFLTYRGRITRDMVDKKLRWWANSLLNFIELSHEVHGVENFKPQPDRTYMIMCNHSSLYDIPLSLAALPGSIRMLAKKELTDVPFWGRAMKASEFLSISRDDGRQAVKDIKTATEAMRSGIILWSAPEGGRSRDGKLKPFKKGVFKLALGTEAVVIPVGLCGVRDALPAKSARIKKGVKAEVHVGTPIDTRRYTRKTRDELIKEVERQIRSLARLD